MKKKRTNKKSNLNKKNNLKKKGSAEDKPEYYVEKVPGKDRLVVKKITPDMDISNMVQMVTPEYIEVSKKPGEEGTFLIRSSENTSKPIEITGDPDGIFPKELRDELDEFHRKKAVKAEIAAQRRELDQAAAPLQKTVFAISRDEMIQTMGKRLMAVREHLGVAQLKMAEELCVSRAHLYRMERGETAPNAMVLKNLSAVFDVSMDWFFTGKGVMIRSLARQKYQEWDFGKDEKFIQKLLEKMFKIPPLRYAMLTYFDDYYAQNKEFLDKILAEWERFHEKYKADTEQQPEPKAVLNVIEEKDGE